jgi:hypothetical protein
LFTLDMGSLKKMTPIKQWYYSFIISKMLVYIFNIFYLTNSWNSLEKSLSHKMCFTPGIFNNIFRWQFFLEKYQYIEKKVSCWNKCSVFRVWYWNCMMYVSWKTFSLPPWTCMFAPFWPSHNYSISHSKNTTFIPTWHFLFNILIFFIPIYFSIKFFNVAILFYKSSPGVSDFLKNKAIVL